MVIKTKPLIKQHLTFYQENAYLRMDNSSRQMSAKEVLGTIQELLVAECTFSSDYNYHFILYSYAFCLVWLDSLDVL